MSTQQEIAADGTEGRSHIELVETYFDTNAQSWSDLYRRAKRVNDLVLADRKTAGLSHLERHLAAGARVLDAGCGAGLLTADLVQRGYFVHGVDVSSKMLEVARRNMKEHDLPADRWELACTDVVSAAFPDGCFDGVAALGFLQYQTDELAALRELHRILRPGGVLVVTGPTRIKLANWLGLSRYYYALRRRLARLRRSSAPRPAAATAPGLDTIALLHRISAHAYSYGRFRGLLREAGFRVVAQRGHGYVNWEIIGRRLGFRGEMFLHRFFTAVARVLPIGRWANDLIFVARKP